MKSLSTTLLVIAAVGVGFSPLCIRRAAVPVEEKTVELHITLADTGLPVKSPKNRELRNVPGKAICSGMFIDDNGTILTARHCTEGVQQMDVLTSDHRVYVASFVAKSNSQDLALVRIDRQKTPFFTLADVVKRGEAISVLGSPMGETGVLSQGTVAKLTGDQLIVDCSVVPGNSGGPVFDADGKLIGVAVAVFVSEYGMTHLGVVEGPDAVRAFLRSVLKKKFQ